MTEFTSEWIAQTREQLKLVSPLPWKACSCGKCGRITGEKDLIAIATRGNIEAQYIAEASNNYPEALNHIERLQKENKELKEFVDATRPTGICEICTSNVISRYESLQARVQELEHYKRLNEEWVHEKVEGLTTLEEIEKMVMLADKLNKSNPSIRCGWCDAEFETREQVKEHAYGCKDNPLAKRIEKYNQLIVNLFSFLERDRLVRAHAKEMSEFIQEYREIKEGE